MPQDKTLKKCPVRDKMTQLILDANNYSFTLIKPSFRHSTLVTKTKLYHN